MQRVKSWRRPGISGTLYRGDALELLRTLRPASADLVFLDPPFNLGKRYSSKRPELDRRSESDYLSWLKEVLVKAVRVVKPGGALFLYHMPEWAVRVADQLGQELLLRHWIAISMKNGFARGRRLYPAHYALLYYTKGHPKVFDRPKLMPHRCRHCHGLVKDYGGYTSIIEEKGINLSDVWDDLSPVRHASRKHRKENELPGTLTDRIVAIAGVKNGLFVDPFAGSGVSLLSAACAGMRFKAGDLLNENCAIIRERLDNFKITTRGTRSPS